MFLLKIPVAKLLIRFQLQNCYSAGGEYMFNFRYQSVQYRRMKKFIGKKHQPPTPIYFLNLMTRSSHISSLVRKINVYIFCPFCGEVVFIRAEDLPGNRGFRGGLVGNNSSAFQDVSRYCPRSTNLSLV